MDFNSGGDIILSLWSLFIKEKKIMWWYGFFAVGLLSMGLMLIIYDKNS